MDMHDNEFPIHDALVRQLVATQMPALAGLDLRRIPSSGTVNAVYRLGDDMVVRLPRTAEHAHAPQHEARWMPVIAARVPLQVAQFVALGEPTDAYPSYWSALEWIGGTAVDAAALTDVRSAATKLGDFTVALRSVPISGAPVGGNYRGFGLANVDGGARRWIQQLPHDIDRAAVLDVWEWCLSAPEWDGLPTWFHGDLRGDNLITRDGELVGVIDWESCTVGDPSSDFLAAWWLFSGPSRETFRIASQADDDAWRRAMGWALHMSIAAIPYYAETNPAFAQQARRALTEVLVDYQTNYA